ncbi:sugar nucleotide-binding protein [Pseudomonas sp. PCH199]|nr:sugar nucleotide-binding protein [Pseudomonas sp. PCH199]PAM83546.1 hypothetical protein CES87_11315 [Pseudomonas sp. ERMR1:02]
MSLSPKSLICGQHGQVSRELQRRLKRLGGLIVRGRDQLDLTQPAQTGQQVQRLRPDLIINAAAYTAVNQAAQEREQATGARCS